MKKIMMLAVAALVLAGCTQTQQRTGGGALIGAGTGAAIGAVAGGGKGAAVGAAIGAGAGAVAGAATAPRNCVRRDQWGNEVRVSC